MKNLIPFLLTLILCFRMNAQSVVIPDAAFRNYLVSNHPSLMNGSQQLIISAANSYNGILSCSNLSITDLTGIEHFTSLTGLDCSHNNLASIPNLSNLTSLQTLTCNNNQLTSITGLQNLSSLVYLTAGDNLINTLPNLSALSQLKLLNIPHNQITGIPGLSSLISLTHVYCYNNNITSLESVSNLSNLVEFICKNNQLTTLPSFAGLNALQELNFGNNPISTFPSINGCSGLLRLRAYTCGLTSLPDLSAFTSLQVLDINSNQLNSLPGVASLTNLNTLIINNNVLSFEDLLPLKVLSNFSSFIISPQDTLGAETQLTVDELKSVTFSFSIDNNVNGNVYEWSKNEKTIATTNQNRYTIAYAQEYMEGEYYCKVTNSQIPSISLISKVFRLKISSCQESGKECFPVITPDGDGINDIYYIGETAVVKVYSLGGQLITEFNAPGAWDGKDKHGKLVTMGVYALVAGENEPINITVIK